MTPHGVRSYSWQAADLQKEIALQHLDRNAEQSAHIVRLRGSEKPHFHDKTDLTAIVLRGKVNVHFADKVIESLPGDVIEIPRGTLHWVENIHPEFSEAYVIFSPAFDGKDRRFVDAP